LASPNLPQKLTLKQLFLISTIFTAPLLLHMFPFVHIVLLHKPWVQCLLSLPVYILGIYHFGKTAWRSLLAGLPNMNVLIVLGATAAMVYSFFGWLFLNDINAIFFETAATTITLVFLGNWLEEKTTNATQAELNKLMVKQAETATMIAFDQHYTEQFFDVPISSLRVGDLLLIKQGEAVPADCKILWGNVQVNEALITGESTPISKQEKDTIIAGSIVEYGTVKAYTTAVGKDTILQKIIGLAKEAQVQKPPVQLLADKISAVFVPAVIVIAIAFAVINIYFLQVNILHPIPK
jgi:Cu+-exporting ATPase